MNWYQRKRIVIPALLFFPPLGIPLIWLSRWSRGVKIGASIFSALIFISTMGSGDQPSPKTVASSTPASPSAQASPSPSASPSPVASVTPEASPSPSPSPEEKAWHQNLPPENEPLKEKYMSNSFLAGYLNSDSVRFVKVSGAKELLERGFFINADLNHDGQGTAPKNGVAVGSCSAIDLTNQHFVCGVGAFDGWQWGVQSEKAREQFLAIAIADELKEGTQTAPAEPAVEAEASEECDPSYPDMCIDPGAADLDCGEVSQQDFTVRQPDPHGFDRDKDGIGCES